MVKDKKKLQHQEGQRISPLAALGRNDIGGGNVNSPVTASGDSPLYTRGPLDAANLAEGTLSAAQVDQEVKPVIGLKQIKEARQTLQKYKDGKKNLEARVIANEQWYKLRHGEYIRSEGADQQVEPVSAWLFNNLATKHADMMDNAPMANFLPREEGDKDEARRLSAVVPVVLDQTDFEEVYSDHCDNKLRSGIGVYGIFWNNQKLNGLGDVDIREMEILNLFWEPGVSDIQKSENFFSVELWPNKLLEQSYPQLQGKLHGRGDTVSEYVYDDTVSTDEKSLVIDWYYKKFFGTKQVLHYCKFVGDTVLFASENEDVYRDRGWYDHGKYPFVFDPMFKVKGNPCGFGFVDLAKSAQEYIDKGNQAMMKNLQANARPRYFIREDGGVNEKEFADLNKDLVHVNGNLGQDSLMPIQGAGLDSVYVTMLQNKIEELKETTGNRDISNGGTTSGVTAAAALAALQETGSKLSRDCNKASFRRFKKVIQQVHELIRQFYTLERCFRIQGEDGQDEYIRFSNAGIKPQEQPAAMGMDKTYRLPLFDIEVSVQKQSAYSKLSQNELALQLYNAGFFNPQMADQALACLDVMDIDRKQFIIAKIQTNQTLFTQLQQAQMRILQLTQIVDKLTGKNLTASLGAQMGIPAADPAGQVAMNAEGARALGAEATEAATTKEARKRVAESTAPN